MANAIIHVVDSNGNAVPIYQNTTIENVSGLQSALDAKSGTNHTHGNINNNGTLQTTDISIANGDKLIVTDSSNSGKVARSSVAFDGSTDTQCLTKKGTFKSFNYYTHPSAAGNTGSYGNSSNLTPAFGDTFNVPYITINSDGHVTAAANKTVKIPTLSTKTGSISFSKTTTWVSTKIYQEGHIVTGQIYVTFSSAIAADTETEIASISGVDKPVTFYRGFGGVGTGAYYPPVGLCYFYVSSSTGKIGVRVPAAIASNKTYMLNFSYSTV